MQKMTSTSVHCANLWRGCCPHGGLQCRNASEAAGNYFSLIRSKFNCDSNWWEREMTNIDFFIVRKIYKVLVRKWQVHAVLEPVLYTLHAWPLPHCIYVPALEPWRSNLSNLFACDVRRERGKRVGSSVERSTLTWQSLPLVIHFSSQIMSSFPFFSPDPLFFLFTRHLLPAPSSPL